MQRKGIAHLAQVEGKVKLCFQWEWPPCMVSVIRELYCLKSSSSLRFTVHPERQQVFFDILLYFYIFKENVKTM